MRPPGGGWRSPAHPCPAKETGRRLTVGGLQDRVGRLSTSGPPTSPDPRVARRWSLAPFLLLCRGSQPTGSLGEHHPPLTAALRRCVATLRPDLHLGRPLRRRGAGSKARRRYSVTGEARLREDTKNRRRGLRQSAIGVWGDTPVRTPNRVITSDVKPSAGSAPKAEPGARRSLPHAGSSPAAWAASRRAPSVSGSAARTSRRCGRFLVLLQERDTLAQPLRRRGPLQVVVEELEVTDRQVLPVRDAAQAVALARVREQDRLLAVVAQRVVEAEARCRS